MTVIFEKSGVLVPMKEIFKVIRMVSMTVLSTSQLAYDPDHLPSTVQAY